MLTLLSFTNALTCSTSQKHGVPIPLIKDSVHGAPTDANAYGLSAKEGDFYHINLGRRLPCVYRGCLATLPSRVTFLPVKQLRWSSCHAPETSAAFPCGGRSPQNSGKWSGRSFFSTKWVPPSSCSGPAWM